MNRFRFAVVAISGCIVGPACQAIVGIEDRVEAPPLDDASVAPDVTTTTTNEGGPDADASDGDAGACPPGADVCLAPDAAPEAGCPTVCLPPAPAGWQGPSATYDGVETGKPAGCPATYTQKDRDTYFKMTAAPASCECGAPSIEGRSCTAGVATFNDSSCTVNPVKIATAATIGCTTTNSDMGSYYRVATPTLVPGACKYNNAKTTLPAPSFERVEVACSQPDAGACATKPGECIDTPAPAQPFGRFCIHKEGDHACPSEDYPAQFVAHKTFNEGRSCTTCTATPVGGACASNSWGTRADQDCIVGAAPTDKTAPNCYQYLGSGTIIDIRAMAPTAATCTPTGGAPTGTAALADPVTYCCNK
jgi:hypothetical protein